MRNNYFIKLIKYINNVYHIDKKIKYLADKRVNPTFKTSQIAFIALIGFLLRTSSMNVINCYIKTGEFNWMKKRIPKVDTIRNSLKSINLDGLREINTSIIKKAIRNKVLAGGTIDGYIVAAIDGTKLFNTKDPHCDDCLSNTTKGKEYFSHNCSVVSLIGEGANLVIDYEMHRRNGNGKDTSESEIVASKRLLSSVVLAHIGLIDVVAYDALAGHSVFINHCIDHEVDAVIRLKKSHILSIKKVKRETNRKKHVKEFEDGKFQIKAYESLFYMDGVDKPLRYIKFSKDDINGNKTQVLILTTSMAISIKTLYKIMKARWNIEKRVFNNLKNNANLNHCYVHGGNAVEAVLYLMFISSNLLQLFKVRRLKNIIQIQKELVRLLLRDFYALAYYKNKPFASG